MRRSLAVTGVVGFALASAGLGWAVGQQIESPDEAARSADAPPASAITVPVERRALSANVVIRGDITYEDAAAVRLAVSEGIVTKSSPEAGTSLEEGQLLVEIDSRPTFVLSGELPAYRDITPGLKGDDIAQLQSSLQRLGLYGGVVDGEFDAGTQDAVRAFYAARGYDPRPPTKEQLDALDAATKGVEAARDSLRDAQQAVEESTKGLSELERFQLDQAVRLAEANFVAAQAARQPAIDAAAVELADANAALVAAQAAKANAEAGLDAAKRSTDPDTGLPLTPLQLAPYEQLVAEATSGVRQAERAVTAAAAKLAAEPAVQDALIAAAADELHVAELSRADRLQPQDASAAIDGVKDATNSLTQAETSLAAAELAAGLTVPKSELVFLRELPRRIDASNAHRGQPVPQEVVQVSGTGLVIDATVSAADRQSVRTGAEATLDDRNQGLTFTGTIVFVADKPGTRPDGSSAGSGDGQDGGVDGASGAGSGSASSRYAIRIQPQLPDGMNPIDLAGINVRVTIPVSGTTGEVLAVPVAALSAGPDGTPRLEVEDDPGVTRIVEVATGISAQGLVEVTPLGGASLEEGDRVIIGTTPTGGVDELDSTDDSVSDDTVDTDVSDSSDVTEPDVSDATDVSEPDDEVAG